MTPGRLRIYLGAAPGVGKTMAMLDEGHRRLDRGTDVVVGFVETHGRPHTAAAVGDLEVVPRREVEHRGTSARDGRRGRPRPPRPRSRSSTSSPTPTRPAAAHAKRWQDVEDAARRRDRRHLAPSTSSTWSRSTTSSSRSPGSAQQETVPDRGRARRRPDRAGRHVAARAAPADGARQRLPARPGRRRPGQLLPRGQPDRPARAVAAVARRPGRRGARGLPARPRASTCPWPARERVVVAVTGGPESAALLRRGGPDRVPRRRG